MICRYGCGLGHLQSLRSLHLFGNPFLHRPGWILGRNCSCPDKFFGFRPPRLIRFHHGICLDRHDHLPAIRTSYRRALHRCVYRGLHRGDWDFQSKSCSGPRDHGDSGVSRRSPVADSACLRTVVSGPSTNVRGNRYIRRMLLASSTK